VSPPRPLEIDLDLPEEESDDGRPPGSAWLPLEDDERTLRWVSRAAWTVLLLAFLVFLVRGADRTVRPRLIPTGGAVPSHTVSGFSEVAFTVSGAKVPPAQAKNKHCALYANTEKQRERGLMNRRDLGGYDGMIFQFPAPTMTPFYMKDTLIPLSIAWFSGTGAFINQTDMVPCVGTASCQLYNPSAPYTLAIEVVKNDLARLQIGPGTIIRWGGPCGV
jgi:uncharacterized membrane protein (UPF0127 family)